MGLTKQLAIEQARQRQALNDYAEEMLFMLRDIAGVIPTDDGSVILSESNIDAIKDLVTKAEGR